MEPFPWELSNTDYFRRVVAQVGYALQPLVEDIVKDKVGIIYVRSQCTTVRIRLANEPGRARRLRRLPVVSRAACAPLGQS